MNRMGAARLLATACLAALLALAAGCVAYPAHWGHHHGPGRSHFVGQPGGGPGGGPWRGHPR